MTLTLEDKVASLRKRWFELHPPKPSASDAVKQARRVLVSRSLEPATVKGKEWNPTRLGPGETQDISQLLQDSIALENLRKFIRGEYKRGMTNNSPYLLHLKNVEWVGNIAVGVDKRFDTMEWWSVCPPVGVLISFVGATARARAIAKAHELKEYY